ncbi:hypothetical protein Vretifemale_14795, partial [Volvox reticuliferus]
MPPLSSTLTPLSATPMSLPARLGSLTVMCTVMSCIISSMVVTPAPPSPPSALAAASRPLAPAAAGSWLPTGQSDAGKERRCTRNQLVAPEAAPDPGDNISGGTAALEMPRSSREASAAAAAAPWPAEPNRFRNPILGPPTHSSISRSGPAGRVNAALLSTASPSVGSMGIRLNAGDSAKPPPALQLIAAQPVGEGAPPPCDTDIWYD